MREGLAILRYDTTMDKTDPDSSPQTCSVSAPCPVLNCPFPSWQPEHQCVSVADLKSVVSNEFLDHKYGLQTPGEDIVELFYRFAFVIGSSVNARELIPPRTSLAGPDVEKYVVPCNEEECVENGCRCTYMQVDRAHW